MSWLHRFGTVALLATLALPLAPSDAAASVSIAVSFDQLVKDADSVAVITAGEGQSAWEDGRIVTYTKVHVDQGVAGELVAGNDTYVRTLGGVVGKIGQLVDGEPVLIKDKPSLLFLRKFKAGAFEVSARGQGQYPVVVDDKTKVRKIIRSSSAGMILPPKPVQVAASGVQTQSVTQDQRITMANVKLAHETLHDRPVDDGAKEIATAWKRLHAPPPNATQSTAK
jgi:hypothetical protein